MIRLCLRLLLLAAMTANTLAADVKAAGDAMWSPLGAMVNAQIAAGKLPGAVLVVGDEKGVLYHAAFGNRATQPKPEAMTEDTIFDLASLTKAVATTTAVLQLVEQGKLRLDEPVSRWWPEFANKGKSSVTVRHLLSHTSGLPADLDLQKSWHGHAAAMRLIETSSLEFTPGTNMLYSDVNFEALGELVQRASGTPLDVYCQQHIFTPLGMHDTGYLPNASLQNRIAPTSVGRGRVHDPSAARMDGVSGHAGVFSTAADLSRFAQAMLNGGELDGVRILQSSTIEKLVQRNSPAESSQWRGLGWQLIAPFVANRDQLPPVGAYGHLGFTGTALWIDPITRRYIVLLTNRVYPDDSGDVTALRHEILSVISNMHAPLGVASLSAIEPEHAYDFALPPPAPKSKHVHIMAGIDTLEAEAFDPLQGMRVALVTNQTAVDSHSRRTIDALRWAPGVTLTAIFTPEHGLYANTEGKQASGIEPISGIPTYSLYGSHRKPTPEELAQTDALVFDIQDAGVRFYTYIATMAYCMDAAAKQHIPIFILDRPNPLRADRVTGPVLDADQLGFTGYFRMPLQPGMTLGEMALMFNAENHIGADLHIIPLQRYQRDLWFDQTGLDWIPPSPNLRTVSELILYPGVGAIEGANISVGRGTPTPFQLVGAPWINGKVLANYLNKRKIPGVVISETSFTPDSSNDENQLCHGVHIQISDRNALDAPRLAIELAAALHHLYPDQFKLDATLSMIGTHQALANLHAGDDPHRIEAGWQASLEQFRKLRQRYLIY